MSEDIEELKEQTQAGSRVTAAAEQESKQPLRKLVIDELEAIDSGERKTLAIRDESLSALFNALENDPDEMQRVLEALAKELDRDVDDTNKSELLRLAARVGLQEVVPEAWDEVLEARKEMVARQA
jgi:uncharacterized protein YpuA (DUF1002 family)